MPSGRQTDLAVIIVTRNTRALTSAALRSVFESRDALAKEVVVVDNGSTDETPQVLPREFPQANFIRSETNLGFARANNVGAGATTGQFLLLLNSDARLNPEALAEAVGWLRAHPDCGVAGGQLLNPDGSRQNSIANFPTLATELLNKSLLRWLCPRRFPGKEQPLAEPLEVETVIGALMLIRREVWQALGGLDERFFFFFEETDFCLRTRKLGWKVFHLPHVQVWHEQGGSARQMSVAARIEYWRSRYAYFQKNCGPLARGLLRGGLCARLLADWLASGLLVLATLGSSPRWRQKWRVNNALWLWHLRGCPARMGLPR
jgi:GT2 family glycosyltransferase